MSRVKSGMMVVAWVALLSAVGCRSPIVIDVPCSRAGYWEQDARTPLPRYAHVLTEAFNIDATGEAHRYIHLFERVDYLENLCWATRGRR